MDTSRTTMNWARQARASIRPVGTSRLRGDVGFIGTSSRMDDLPQGRTGGTGVTVRDSEQGARGPYSPPPPPLVVRDADLGGAAPVDVVLEAGVIRAVGPGAARGHDGEAVDARGGALLPGLHDHHLHLRSLAAAVGSVTAGPPEV